jgi:hypothetical protein
MKNDAQEQLSSDQRSIRPSHRRGGRRLGQSLQRSVGGWIRIFHTFTSVLTATDCFARNQRLEIFAHESLQIHPRILPQLFVLSFVSENIATTKRLRGYSSFCLHQPLAAKTEQLNGSTNQQIKKAKIKRLQKAGNQL